MKTRKISKNKKKVASGLTSTLKVKSYSPQVNRLLDISRLETIVPQKVNLCDSLLKINIGTKTRPNCLEYNNKKVTEFMLRNLRSTKHLVPTKFIGPKQLTANCWFNTMFVAFFFSDKGRKFFRFLRVLMITGQKYDKTPLKDEELKKLFFILNLFIEASYNQSDNNKLYEHISHLTNNLNTNFFIKKIYEKINKEQIDRRIPDVDQEGNPLEYYKSIIKFLNYNILKLRNIDIDEELTSNISKTGMNDFIKEKFVSFNVVPDIMILEDHESGMIHNNSYKLSKNGRNYNYKLDSIILTNKNHYNPKANSHFVCVLTINKELYRFDGSSYSRLSKFNWKKILNKNVDWTFKENPKYYAEKYNMQKGYKIMFYYRS